MGEGGPAKELGADEVAITEPIARELDVRVGDDILVRVPIATAIPADSTLGKKSDTSLSRNLKVGAVLPINGLARFGIVPSQQLPRNAFVPLATVQALLKQPGKANLVLLASHRADHAQDANARAMVVKSLKPQLEDYGVTVSKETSPVASVNISADQLVLPEGIVQSVNKQFDSKNVQPVVTYLANTIEVGEGTAQRKIPYSTITGVDSTAELGPLLDEEGQPIKLTDDEIVLNRWAADDLKAKVGDAVTVTFYEPESTHGQLHEYVPRPVFKLRAIAELKTADGKPTAAADPNLTPELPGVTDQKSISDWDLPFELTEKVRRQDEEYWHDYRTTPKAFVSLATAKWLWASRWGTISLLRLPEGNAAGAKLPAEKSQTVESVSERIASAISPASMGMNFLPVKEQGLAAAAGTTPFEGLFLGFSCFLIAAAVMLVALLFRLGIEQRASELGTLAATGINRRTMTRLLAREGTVVAAVGRECGRCPGGVVRMADDIWVADVVVGGGVDAVYSVAC